MNHPQIDPTSATPYIELVLPVPYHHTMDVLDSSKLQTFQDCPRAFFYNYILGWQPEDPNVHLAFGSAWHEAMEVMMKAANVDGYTDEAIAIAYMQFLRVYREAYPNPEEDRFNSPKDPNGAAEALALYASTYSRDSFETLWTEIAVVAPVTESRIIHGKLDSIIRKPDGYWSMEHKTTGRLTRAWQDKWSIMLQVGTYAHILYCLYGEDARGVIINGTVLRRPTKTGTAAEHIRVPIVKSRQMMATWLWEVQYWLSLLDRNMELLAASSADDPVLQCFPRNPTSCTKFGCRYPGLCSEIANPLRLAGNTPPGYRKEFWDPRRADDTAKNELDLRKGLEITPIEK